MFSLLLFTVKTETIKAPTKPKAYKIETVEVVKLETPTVSQPQYISLGEFLVTAYCSCYICCEENALNRPVDENGNEIVEGAIGQVLTSGYSIAVDPSIIPFGTKVYFDGKEHLAQDRGGLIKGNHIDLYLSDHQTAKEWGKKYFEVFVLVESD